MTMQQFIPYGYANVRFAFSVLGGQHPMGFSLGVATPVELPPFPEAGINTSFKSNVLDDGAGMSSLWTYLGLIMSIPNAIGDVDVREQVDSLAGTFNPLTSPPNVAHLIQKRTGLAGRHNRGRIFMPPAMLLDVDVDQAGNTSAAFASSHTVLWEAFRADIDALGFPPVLFHQYDPDLAQVPRLPTSVTEFVVQGRVATQRRRLR